jgi:hypothetical protein
VPQFVDGDQLDFIHPLAAQTHPVRNLFQGENCIESRPPMSADRDWVFLISLIGARFFTGLYLNYIHLLIWSDMD